MVGKAHKSLGFLILLILVCCLIGSFLGDLMKPIVPAGLSQTFKIALGPFPLDLKFLYLTFGISLNMNLMSIVGLIIAVIIYMRY